MKDTMRLEINQALHLRNLIPGKRLSRFIFFGVEMAALKHYLRPLFVRNCLQCARLGRILRVRPPVMPLRSEEHTSELQSQSNLVCRLLLEKKKTKKNNLTLRKKKKKKNAS